MLTKVQKVKALDQDYRLWFVRHCVPSVVLFMI